MLTETQRDLARVLMDVGAVKFGAFRLKLHETTPDAPLSPIYIDLRLLRSFPEAMRSAAIAYRELAQGLAFDRYADVPTAATPLVAALSLITNVGMVSPRLDAKTHGSGRSIDGVVAPGQAVLVVDDLITHSESKFGAIRILEAADLVVRDVLVLIDREQGGVQKLAEHGYQCHAALRLSQLLTFYRDGDYISEENYNRTAEYLHVQMV